MRWLPILLCAAATLVAGQAGPGAHAQAAAAGAEEDVYTLVHRVQTPRSASAWAPRAHLKLLANDPENAEAHYRRIAGEREWASLLASAGEKSLYQVALVPGAWEQQVGLDAFPAAPLSSTKLCTLTSAAPHEVTVIATPLSEQTPLAPLAIEYAAQVERAALDGRGCIKDPAPYPIEDPNALTVRVRHPFQARLPALRLKPVEANEDASKPVVEDVPEPEKTFLQKYWMYIIPILIVLMTSKPPPPEERGGGEE